MFLKNYVSSLNLNIAILVMNVIVACTGILLLKTYSPKNLHGSQLSWVVSTSHNVRMGDTCLLQKVNGNFLLKVPSHNLHYDRRPDSHFVVWVAMWNTGCLRGKEKV